MSDKVAPYVSFQAIASLYDASVQGGKMTQNIADFLAVFHYEIECLKCSSPCYLELPESLRGFFAADPLYLAGLPVGRVSYRNEQEVFDERTESLLRDPLFYSRQEVHDMIDKMIRIPNTRIAACLPLAYNIGFAVGWLSGLSIAQKDDAAAGMVILAVIVAPLVVSSASKDNRLSQSVNKRALKSLKVKN